uniref:Uncharacterized protein n=1 Tax=Physcomitrium patens TaxID=3218 RepID=A0A7I3ZC39_PHYPA
MAVILSITSEADAILLTSTQIITSLEASTDRPCGVDRETMFGGDGMVEEAKQLLLDQTTHT